MTDKTNSIEVAPYDPRWPKIFAFEAAIIKEALGDNCIDIHHIGSTSVPGLAAKSKIDIIAVVKDPIKAIPNLEAVGLTYKGEYNILMHYGFSKRGDVDINLHVYETGHPEIELNILFRDYLRKNSSARDEYAALKERLLQDDSSFEKDKSSFRRYTLRKGEFIRKILKETGFSSLRVLKCTDSTEWSAAKNFRQKYFFDNVSISDPYTWTFDHPNHVHLICYQGSEIIGYAHIQLWTEARAAIRIIVLDQKQRNQGLGRQFLGYIEKWLKRQNYKSIHAEASPEAVTFYKKLGYTSMPFNDPDSHENDPRDIPMGKMLCV